MSGRTYSVRMTVFEPGAGFPVGDIVIEQNGNEVRLSLYQQSPNLTPEAARMLAGHLLAVADAASYRKKA